MIISHKYKYIFLKTTKTAGSSIEISLSRFCGTDDIITPLTKEDEKIRKEFGVFPKNHTRPLKPWEYTYEDFVNLIFQGKKPKAKKIFWNHITAKEIKKIVGAKIWNDYFKFCFVRNPWDRAISRYYWNQEKTKKIESLQESLKNNNPNSNFDIYTIDGELAVDYVGKYETLMEDLDFICNKLNIPFDGWLPRAKGKVRKNKTNYAEILTEEQANFVREKCEREIAWFDYSF